MPIDRSLANTIISHRPLSWPSIVRVVYFLAVWSLTVTIIVTCSKLGWHPWSTRWRHMQLSMLTHILPCTRRPVWPMCGLYVFCSYVSQNRGAYVFQCQLVGGQNGYNSPGFVSVGIFVAGGWLHLGVPCFKINPTKSGEKKIAGKNCFSSDLSERPKI